MFLLYISKMSHISISGLSGLMTLNMCHVLFSALGSFFPGSKSVNLCVLPTYNVLPLIRYVMLWPRPLILWSWTSLVYRLWRSQALYQISPKSKNPGRSYWDLDTPNLGAVPFLDLTGSVFSQCGFQGFMLHRRIKYQQNLAMHRWVINESTHFLARFQGGGIITPLS